ncbi:MAG: hypothetical protein JWO10_1322 [Microbacteriaceae bacterium]|nr:hypothetical protein [Microbacteriaceae bacterium]
MAPGLARISLAAVGMVLVSTLVACASGTAAPGSGATTTPVPTPTATATQASTADVLFTITANVRSKDGTTIGIQLTAHEPIAYSKAESKPLITDFVKACGAGLAGTPVTADTLSANGAILMQIDLASSVHDQPFAYPLDLFLGSPYFGQAVTGKGISPLDTANNCFGGYSWDSAGSAIVVADFESGNPGPDLGSWRYASYGFSVPFDSGTTIEACKVTLTDKATAANVSTVDGWDPSQAASGTSCVIGYAGE